jgi:hypothetical protein
MQPRAVCRVAHPSRQLTKKAGAILNIDRPFATPPAAIASPKPAAEQRMPRVLNPQQISIVCGMTSVLGVDNE